MIQLPPYKLSVIPVPTERAGLSQGADRQGILVGCWFVSTCVAGQGLAGRLTGFNPRGVRRQLVPVTGYRVWYGNNTLHDTMQEHLAGTLRKTEMENAVI